MASQLIRSSAPDLTGAVPANMASKPGVRRSMGSYCCIPGCRSSTGNKDKVYRIPTLYGCRRGVKTKEWAEKFHQVS